MHVLPECTEQLCGATRVESEGSLCDSPMGLKPALETSHERRHKMLFFGRHRKAWADTALNQVAVKELHSKPRVIAGPSAVRLRAAAP